MIKYVEEDLEGVVAVKITKPICRNDYDALIPEIEKKINECGRVNLYLEIRDGVNWNGKNIGSDVNFNLKHAQDFRKVAFVGDDHHEEKIIELLKPIENAEIRWYSPAEKEEALRWLKG